MTNSGQSSLSEHFKGFSAVELDAKKAASSMEQSFLKYGPVVHSEFGDLHGGIKYLLPLKSFNTRFLILGVKGWSFLVTDMREEYCCVDAYGISRATNCKAICIVAQEKHRELQVFENGSHIREIQSLADGNRWVFREEGLLQPFENPGEYRHKIKSKRLSVDAVHQYFERYTGLQMPDWVNTQYSAVYGLERSNREARVPLVRFNTVNDLPQRL